MSRHRLLFAFAAVAVAAAVTAQERPFVMTAAGVPGVVGFEDGPVASALFNRPTRLDIVPDERYDAGRRGEIYVIDRANRAIRKIGNGQVSTYRPATSRRSLISPSAGRSAEASPSRRRAASLAADYTIAASSSARPARSRSSWSAMPSSRVLTTDGQLTTIAGTPGVAGFADGPASSAKFSGPVGLKVALDGSIYVADPSNNVIRRVILAKIGEGPRFRAVRH